MEEREPTYKRRSSSNGETVARKKRKDDASETPTSFIDEREINKLANKIGFSWHSIGINLGYTSNQLEHLKNKYLRHSVERTHVMLTKWMEVAKDVLGNDENVQQLLAKCLCDAEEKLLAETVSPNSAFVDLKAQQDEIDRKLKDINFDIRQELHTYNITCAKEARRRCPLEAWKKKDEMFAETRSYSEAKRCLKKQGFVTIVGPPGDGKTGIVIRLALQHQKEDFEIIQLKESETIEEYCDPRKKQLLILDDLFGPFSVNMLEIQMFVKKSDYLSNCIENGRMKIIVTLRTSIFRECMPELSKSFIGNYIVDLSSANFQLNQDERKSIIDKYSRYISKKNLCKLSKISDYFPGFPLLCFAYSTNQDLNLTTEGSPSELDPTFVLRQQIQAMEKANKYEYCALVLTAMFDGEFDCDDLDDLMKSDACNAEGVERIKTWIQTCGLEATVNVLLIIKTSFQNLRNVYLFQEDDDKYIFLHDYINEAVIFLHCKNNKKSVLNHCSSYFIRDRIRLDRPEEGKSRVFIPKRQYDLLAKRLQRDLMHRQICAVFNNPSLENIEFQRVFTERLSTLPPIELKRLLTQMPEEVIHYEGITLSLDAAVFTSTPIHWLCRLGCLDMLKQLLIHLDVSPEELFSSLEGHTQPLHFAAGYGHLVMVKYLLLHEQDVNAKSSLKDVGQSVGEFYSGFTPLFYAARQNYTEVVECLLQNGANPDIVREHGASPMLLAADKGHSKVISLLLQFKSDPNLCCEHGTSPLFISAQEGHLDAVKTLVNGEANVNHQKPSTGMTPLSIAAKKGHCETLHYLLKHGANPNLFDKEGDTALHKAVQRENLELIKMLLKYDASKLIKNESGKTPYAIASELNNTRIMELLS